MKADSAGAPNTPSSQPGALVVTGMDNIETTAAALARSLSLTVEVVFTRAAALRLLSRRAFAVIILDQILADSDREGADLIWKCSGTAIPLQINFALAGVARLEREVRAALTRRQREMHLAGAAAAAAIDADLKNAVTGLLLESRLALAESDIPPRVQDRLRTLAEMADRLRERLVPTVPAPTTPVSLMATRK
jgi:hypothetical protein